jgi:hypothetical protein
MLKLFHSRMSAVCPHYSAVFLHFSALLQTVCICPHLLSAVVCSVHKINSCRKIHGKKRQLNCLKILHSLTRSEVYGTIPCNMIPYLFPLIALCMEQVLVMSACIVCICPQFCGQSASLHIVSAFVHIVSTSSLNLFSPKSNCLLLYSLVLMYVSKKIRSRMIHTTHRR